MYVSNWNGLINPTKLPIFNIIIAVVSKTAEEELGNIQKQVIEQQNNVKVFFKTAYYRVNHDYLLFESAQVEG